MSVTQRFILKQHLRIQRWIRWSSVHSMLLWSVVVGVAGALATVAFREGIDALDRLPGIHASSVVDLAGRLPWPVRVAFPAVGGLLAGVCLLIARRKAAPQSHAEYMDAITLGDGNLPVWQSLWRSLSSMLTIASGGSIGREGAMVQLAALAASVTGKWCSFDPQRLRLLVACGAAAGITSAYNAPIAGAFFISEIVLGSMAMEYFGPIVVSAMVANITMREFVGYRPPYEMPPFPMISGAQVLLFILLGLLCGVFAPYFLRLVGVWQRQFSRLPLALPIRLALGGVVVGVISVWWPEVWGNGYEVVNSILHQPWTWNALAAVLVVKVIATATTVGSGAVGGIFTPTIFVGAIVGALFGIGMHAIWPNLAASNAVFAMVGMAAFLAAATHAPVMAMLMIFEMTLSYQVILPLGLACVIAYFTARSLGLAPMYAVTARRAREQDARLRLATTRMGELISPADTVVKSTDDVREMAFLFLKYPVKYLYVVDEGERFLGVVEHKSITADLLGKSDSGVQTAASYINRDFTTLTSDMSLGDALACFHGFRGERLPVVTQDSRRLIGVVYKSTLLDTLHRLSFVPV